MVIDTSMSGTGINEGRIVYWFAWISKIISRCSEMMKQQVSPDMAISGESFAYSLNLFTFTG